MKNLSQIYNSIAGYETKAAHQAQIELTEEMRKQNQAVYLLIEQQKEANAIQIQSNELIKKQVDLLRKTNMEQGKELKFQKIWTIVSWIITTLVAISSVVVQFINN